MLKPIKHMAYYRNLHHPSVVKSIRFRFKGKSIIYGIRCRATDMIYIGSTFNSLVRINQHLVLNNYSNLRLQYDISKYGLEYFNFYVFEEVNLPVNLSRNERAAHLHKIEQQYINKFNKTKLYNVINSFKV